MLRIILFLGLFHRENSFQTGGERYARAKFISSEMKPSSVISTNSHSSSLVQCVLECQFNSDCQSVAFGQNGVCEWFGDQLEPDYSSMVKAPGFKYYHVNPWSMKTTTKQPTTVVTTTTQPTTVVTTTTQPTTVVTTTMQPTTVVTTTTQPTTVVTTTTQPATVVTTITQPTTVVTTIKQPTTNVTTSKLTTSSSIETTTSTCTIQSTTETNSALVKYLGEHKTFLDAKKLCMEKHKQLVVVQNDTTNEEMAEVARNQCGPAWIGLEAMSPNGIFRWSNGVEFRLGKEKYQKWKSNQPYRYQNLKSCVTIDSDGYWVDVDCNGHYPFACEN